MCSLQLSHSQFQGPWKLIVPATARFLRHILAIPARHTDTMSCSRKAEECSKVDHIVWDHVWSDLRPRCLRRRSLIGALCNSQWKRRRFLPLVLPPFSISLSDFVRDSASLLCLLISVLLFLLKDRSTAKSPKAQGLLAMSARLCCQDQEIHADSPFREHYVLIRSRPIRHKSTESFSNGADSLHRIRLGLIFQGSLCRRSRPTVRRSISSLLIFIYLYHVLGLPKHRLPAARHKW